MQDIKMKYLKPIICIIVLVLIDQFTKYLIISNFTLGSGMPLIEGVFEFSYIRNEGAAWGMMQGKQLLFYIMTPICIIIACFLYKKMFVDKKFAVLQVLDVFIISGAIGNFIDRIFRGYVVDFLYFKLIDFPVFNVADCYLTVSFALLIILMFFKYSEEDFDMLFSFRKGKE